MAYKTILVCLNEIQQNARLARFAADLAVAHEAHLVGLYVVPANRIYPSASLEPLPLMFEAEREYFEEHVEAVRELFTAALHKAGAIGDFRVARSGSPVIADEVIRRGRDVDLVVLSQTDSHIELDVELDFVERVIVDVGRPVLVLPLEHSALLSLDQVVVGWNGRREAARAAFDSLPLLKRATEVRLVWVDPQRRRSEAGDVPGADLAETMARHGVKVTVEPMPTSGEEAGVALMTKVSVLGAGLLVMGAYGHSRLHEFILGGATRNVLMGMRCPILFAH